MAAEIRVVAGPETGKVLPIPVGKVIVIGRGKEADMQLNDPSVSRAHCQINPSKKGLMIHDLGSRSGVYLNGERVSRHSLKHKDLVQIGQTQFEVVMRARQEPETVLPGDVQLPE